MQGFVAPIEKLATGNDDFRRVLYASGKMQLVLIALKPGEAIGSETHSNHDQFFRIEKGHGQIKIGGAKLLVSAGDAVVVPAGLQYKLTNTGRKRLCLYTVYTPSGPADRLAETAEPAAEVQILAKTVATSAEQGRRDMIDEGSPVVGPSR